MKISLGHGVDIDLSRLITSRMLLQANSGGGKSWTLRRILEQSHGHVQQIVLDPEDEFYTLREKFDYILVRHDGGDCVPEIRSADLLARRLLELGVSAIISIYELSPRDRREFVRRFLESLVNAPKNLWHPALIVVDEAHEFCPEQGKKQKGDAVADAVIDLMAKGRKRGFCGVLSTQRISKLNKDAAAEANNKLIGRASIDVDRKRAGEELGFTTKDDFLSLRQLQAGEFFGFGPAISNDVVRFKVGPVKTTHPKAGVGAVPIAPPKTKVKSILAQLADLPQEAAEEHATVASLQQQLRETKLKLIAAEKAQPATKIETKVKEISVIKDSQIMRIEKMAERMYAEAQRHGKAMSILWGNFDEVATALKNAMLALIQQPAGRAPFPPNLPDRSPLLTGQPTPKISRPQPAVSAAPRSISTPLNNEPTSAGGNDCSLTKKVERALLTVFAQHPRGLTKAQALIYGNYRASGDTVTAFRKFLRCGYVDDQRDFLIITETGLKALGPFDPLPTGDALRSQMLNDSHFKKVERELLRVLFEVYPGSISKREIVERAGYKASGDTVTALRKFRNAGWATVEGHDELRAADELFES